jgi:hypothetical protein
MANYEFSGKDVKIYMGGKVVGGATKLNVKVDRETVNLYVLGSADPFATTKKVKVRTGSLEVYLSEWIAMMRSLPGGGDITDVIDAQLVAVMEAGTDIVPFTVMLGGVNFENFDWTAEKESDSIPVTINFKYRTLQKI